MGQAVPEQPRAGVAARDIDQHSVAQDAPCERRAIRDHRAFVLGAPGDPVVVHARERFARDRLEFIQLQRLHAGGLGVYRRQRLHDGRGWVLFAAMAVIQVIAYLLIKVAVGMPATTGVLPSLEP